MPAGNPMGYFQPQFQPTPLTPAVVPQIPQLPGAGMGAGNIVPSLGSLMQPQQPNQGGFDLMSALQQGNQQIQQAQTLAAQMPTPPTPRKPAPLAAEKPKTIEERVKAMTQGERLAILRNQDPTQKDLIPHIQSQQTQDAQKVLKQQRTNRIGGSR